MRDLENTCRPRAFPFALYNAVLTPAFQCLRFYTQTENGRLTPAQTVWLKKSTPSQISEQVFVVPHPNHNRRPNMFYRQMLEAKPIVPPIGAKWAEQVVPTISGRRVHSRTTLVGTRLAILGLSEGEGDVSVLDHVLDLLAH